MNEVPLSEEVTEHVGVIEPTNKEAIIKHELLSGKEKSQWRLFLPFKKRINN